MRPIGISILVMTRNLARVIGLRSLRRYRPVARFYSALYEAARPKQGVVAVEVLGQKMYVDPSDCGVGAALLRDGVYEEYETELLSNALHPGAVFLEVGAQIGYYALVAARAVGKTGRVVAFEPNPKNYTLLQRNVRENKFENVLAFQKAVADAGGPMPLFVSPTNAGDHRMYDTEEGRGAVEVEAVSLDGFLRDKVTKVDVILLDVQGFELKVVNGMRGLLRENRGVVLFTEFWPAGLKGAGCRPEEYLELLIGEGFELSVIDERARKLRPADIAGIMRRCQGTKSGYVNLLCRRNDRAA
jgi:FkbM family methyltransferase